MANINRRVKDVEGRIPIGLNPDEPVDRQFNMIRLSGPDGALVRRARERAFTVAERDRALASLADDSATLIIVEFTPEITAEARAFLLRHRLRAGDAVQLASCLYPQREISQPLPFVAFDDRLAEAARHEGLTVVPAPKGHR